MKNPIFTLICLILASSFTNSKLLAHENGVESDSGYTGPKYETIMTEMRDVTASYPDLVKFVTYGKSVAEKPLTLLRIGYTSQTTRKILGNSSINKAIKNAVVITGATHGNEYLGVEHKLARTFLSQMDKLPHFKNFIMNGGIVYLMPVFNPDGYARDERENRNNKDLNRDFPVIPINKKGFTQTETASFANYLDQDLMTSNLQLKLSIDYHCCIGAFLSPWSYKEEPMSGVDYDRHKDMARTLNSLFDDKYQYGSTYDVLGYLGVGTSKDYYYAKYGSLSYTFEGLYSDEHKNFDKHVQMWETVFSQF